MNELVISTYIQILQGGFATHNKQESAACFIFDALIKQENLNITTDLNSKKISRLVNRIDPVPDDIQQASVNKNAPKGVLKHFKDKIIPDLNPYTKDDTFQKLINVIIRDKAISDKQKAKFKKMYDEDDEAKLLATAFLYSLQRNNKKISNTVELMDAPLLDEVNYKCPLTNTPLVERVKEVPIKKYVITQIFPEGLSSTEEAAFSLIQSKPENYDASYNLIALSSEASNNYLVKPTVDEFKKLLKIKEKVLKRNESLNSINRVNLEEDIRKALDALIKLKPSDDLPKLSYDALKIRDKIDDYLLKSDVEMCVLQYYRYIESIFSEASTNFDMIAAEVKLSYLTIAKAGFSQEEIINKLAEWIFSKSFTGEDHGLLACKMIVCFFIQNCEVFQK